MPYLPDSFYKSCWSNCRKVHTLLDNNVVPNLHPVPYVGSIPKYRRSKLRAVTLGINPSANPPEDLAWERGHNFSHRINLTSEDAAWWENVLCRYFLDQTPHTWFKHYSRILNSLDVSYGSSSDTATNQAIHIDWASPLATTNTWRHLTEKQKTILRLHGVPTSWELLKRLKPHLILFSSSRENLNSLLQCSEQWPFEMTDPFAQANDVSFGRLLLREGHTSLLVYERQSYTPFRRADANDMATQIRLHL